MCFASACLSSPASLKPGSPASMHSRLRAPTSCLAAGICASTMPKLVAAYSAAGTKEVGGGKRMCGTPTEPARLLRTAQGSRASRWVQDCLLPLDDRPLRVQPALLLFDLATSIAQQQVCWSFVARQHVMPALGCSMWTVACTGTCCTACAGEALLIRNICAVLLAADLPWLTPLRV
jgi:hypothetical protein